MAVGYSECVARAPSDMFTNCDYNFSGGSALERQLHSVNVGTDAYLVHQRDQYCVLSEDEVVDYRVPKALNRRVRKFGFDFDKVKLYLPTLRIE